MQIVTVALHDLQIMFDRNAEKIISALNEQRKSEPETDCLLTIQQVAELLFLSVSTIYGLVSRSEISCMKKGKRLYFSKYETLNWIKSGRKKPLAEIASEISKETDTYLSTLKKKKNICPLSQKAGKQKTNAEIIK